jgi:hypothetical protein
MKENIEIINNGESVMKSERKANQLSGENGEISIMKIWRYQ